MCFCHADRQLIGAEHFNFFDILFCLGCVYNVICTVNIFCDAGKLFFNRQFFIIKRVKVRRTAFLLFNGVADCLRKLCAARSAFGKYIGKSIADTRLGTKITDVPDFRIGVGSKTIERYYDRNTEATHIFYVFLQVGAAFFQRIQVFGAEIGTRNTTVVF